MDKKDRYIAARKYAGMTQVELASKVPMSQQMVSKLEQGRTTESTFDVRIAVVCGVRAEWLGAEDGPMTGASAAPDTGNLKLKADVEALNNVVAAIAVAAVHSTPGLAACLRTELDRLPADYKRQGIYGALLELLERADASQGSLPLQRQGRATRGSTARTRA